MIKNGVTKVVSRFDEVSTSLKSLASRQVLIGISRDTTERDVALNASRGGEDITNAAIGYINEFGEPSLNIPPRPHLVPGVRNGLPRILALLKVAARRATAGDAQGTTAALHEAGLAGQNAVKAKIIAGPFLPLSAVTLMLRKMRGHLAADPLRETGEYINAIRYVVRKRK